MDDEPGDIRRSALLLGVALLLGEALWIGAVISSDSVNSTGFWAYAAVVWALAAIAHALIALSFARRVGNGHSLWSAAKFATLITIVGFWTVIGFGGH